MLPKRALFCLTSLALSFGVLGCDVSTPVSGTTQTDQTLGAEPSGDLLQPKPKRILYDGGQYGGVVTEVGPNWVELGAGWEGETQRKKQLDHKKPKRISATETVPGGDPKGDGEQRTHRVSDLKVGDVVVITVAISREGEEWTTEIEINRRPRGRIPPKFGDPFVGTTDAFHLRDQAEQDWEERGIPIPAKYLSNGRAPWTNPPYPPVAPMPRSPKP